MTEIVPKPDFVPTWGRYEWTPERVEYVRYCAEVMKMTAGDVAEDTGIGRENEHIIRGVAQRFAIKFTGRGRKREHQDICVPIKPDARRVFAALARQHGRDAREIIAAVIEAVAAEGPTFCANLIDMDEA